jgi:hypothetical protein
MSLSENEVDEYERLVGELLPTLDRFDQTEGRVDVPEGPATSLRGARRLRGVRLR